MLEGLSTAILAPTGRDAALAAAILIQAGLDADVCSDMPALCARIVAGAGAVLIAEEALTPAAVQQLHRALQAQEPWSDVPVILFTSGQPSAAGGVRLKKILMAIGNAVIIERPIRAITLVTAVRNACRARQRQYDVHLMLQERSTREEEARSMARVLQQLVGIVSHDLRNPISAIVISAEALLRRHDLNEKQGRGVSRIMKAAQRANSMIFDLLDFTRARLGRDMPLHIQPCDAVVFTQDTVDEVAVAHPHRVLQLAHIGAHTWGSWDAGRLAQVVQNLTTNALRYSADTTTVTVTVDATDERFLAISVHNLGEVIDKAHQQRIFEPLERGACGESSVERPLDNRSIGLGLYIVKQIVAAHGGRIEVHSTHHEGTTFTVYLPRLSHGESDTPTLHAFV